MKAVMISIQPKWCELIANGEKTIEVRKTRPEINLPFKCYIYCTKGSELWRDITGETWNGIDENEDMEEVFRLNPTLFRLNGKVIGEFVCDKIEEHSRFFVCEMQEQKEFNLLKNSYLSIDDINNYLKGTDKFYGWHISDLKIYDEPKELCEFRRISPYCEYRKKHGVERCEKCDKRNVACIQYNCECWTNKNGKAIIKDRRITKPPQSWQYCEELEEK